LPKGLPWKRGEKHLAVEVEDHPIEYETSKELSRRGNMAAARSWCGTAGITAFTANNR
jgi:hypothetical protein